jgi:hypothetical protein
MMKKSRSIKSGLIIITALFVMFAALRLYFIPQWISKHIESHVRQIEDYEVRYRDFDVSLLDGSYTLNHITLQKKDSRLPLPFFEAEKLAIAIDFSSLLTDRWVTEIGVSRPVLNFINGPDEISSQTKISSEWVKTIEDLASFPVNKMKIIGGVINYHDFHSVPRILLSMTDVNLSGSNLHNRDGAERIFTGLVEGSGKVSEGSIQVKMELNAFYDNPTFNLSAELVNLNLSDVRDFLRAYGKVDIQQGIFSLYTEATTKNDKVIGFVKPRIQDVAIASNETDSTLSLLRQNGDEQRTVWTVKLNDFDSQKEISFEGSLDHPGINLWSAAAITLHKAFIEALLATIDSASSDQPHTGKTFRPKNSTPARMSASEPEKKEGFLKRIFKKKDKKKSSD